MSSGDNVKRVKVQPYPIRAIVTGGPAPIRGQILRLTMFGMLVDVGTEILHINERFIVDFELPSFHSEIKLEVKVVKIHDRVIEGATPQKNPANKDAGAAPASEKTDPRIIQKHGLAVQRITEFHYIQLPEVAKKRIHEFLVAIRQIQ